MPRTSTVSSREFNQDTSGAKKAALDGPVVITDRGRPAHVLLTYKAYCRLKQMRHVGRKDSILALLADREAGKIDFEPPTLIQMSRPVALD
ncbi:MAG: type II toxin-antitoxin system Phd/YefM family antitoxin [Burkholderiales bacterium]|jgi:prevent-host-death family protein|nr:type II toxin-antitoxin system Phd/YefM family antitoxin [Burkholderiales bacterium]